MSAAMFLADTLGPLPTSSAATAFCSSASAQARPASESASLALTWRRPYSRARRAARADLPANRYVTICYNHRSAGVHAGRCNIGGAAGASLGKGFGRIHSDDALTDLPCCPWVPGCLTCPPGTPLSLTLNFPPDTLPLTGHGWTCQHQPETTEAARLGPPGTRPPSAPRRTSGGTQRRTAAASSRAPGQG